MYVVDVSNLCMITNYEALCLQKLEVFMQLLGFKITFMTSIRQIIFSAQLAEKKCLINATA